MSSELRTITVPLVPVESEQKRLLSLWSSETTNKYLETRIYKDNKEAVSAFYDGIAFAGLILGTSPNMIRNAMVYKDDLIRVEEKVK